MNLKSRITRLRDLLQNSHPTLRNFFSLGLLRATDALVLLVLIPLIISRVGIDNYGILVFVQVCLNYGKTLIDYGFQISGVRRLALAQNDREQLGLILSNILYARITLSVFFLILLYLLVFFIPFLSAKAPVFYWGAFYIFGHVLFFDWFFIGIQQPRYIAAANLAAKLLFALAVILFVLEPSDYIYILAWQGISGLAIGLGLLYFLRRRFQLQLQPFRPQAVRQILIADFKLLYTNLIIEFNSTYSILILNILTTDALTAYFNVMYKLVQPIRILLVVFSQTIYPVVCQKTQEGWKAVKAYLRKSFLLFCGLPIGFSLLLLIFAQPLLTYFAGAISVSLLISFKIYVLLPLIILLNIPAYQSLLAYEQKDAYSKVYLISVGLKVVLDYLFILYFSLRGLIISILLVEFFIAIGLYFSLLLRQKMN